MRAKASVAVRTWKFKARVHVNRSEISNIIERKLLGLKWVGNTTRQLQFTTPNESPRLVGDCLVSVY